MSVIRKSKLLLNSMPFEDFQSHKLERKVSSFLFTRKREGRNDGIISVFYCLWMSSSYSHKPGPLNKAKKPFKSRHASKSSLKRENKGKVERVNLRSPKSLDYNKQERKNHAIQFQKNKREELMAAKRLGNTNQGPPKLIVRGRTLVLLPLEFYCAFVASIPLNCVIDLHSLSV